MARPQIFFSNHVTFKVSEGFTNPSIEYNNAKEGTATKRRIIEGTTNQKISKTVLWLFVSRGLSAGVLLNPCKVQKIATKPNNAFHNRISQAL